MTVALIDNGSLEPAAHRSLRSVAAALSVRAAVEVHAVSWKHSDRIGAELIDGRPAWTLGPWLRSRFERGERDFVFVPFFISDQGAIGSWLRRDVERVQAEIGKFQYRFTAGLASHRVLTRIVAARIRETIAQSGLHSTPVIVVDHGGPSPTSAALRNQISAEVRRELGNDIGPLVAASLEGAEHAHSQPLFADVLKTAMFDHGDIIIAPLFLGPGRHAGPGGDLAEIAAAAEDRPTGVPLHCHFTQLVGNHADVVPALAAVLNRTLSLQPAAA